MRVHVSLEPTQYQKLINFLTQEGSTEAMEHVHLLTKPGGSDVVEKTLVVEDLKLDVVERILYLGSLGTPLLSYEFAFMLYAMKRPKQLMTREELWYEIYGIENTPTTNALDVLVSRLRTKFKRDLGYEKNILYSVRGKGYVLGNIYGI